MNDSFATLVELPSLTDTAFIALQQGNLNAVEAIARIMKRQATGNLTSEQPC